jgi:hypothetical protein
MKNTRFFRIIAAATSAALLLTLAACGAPAATTSTTSTTDSTSGGATTTTTAPPPKGDLNRLTGEYNIYSANDRFIGYVITDEDSKHIQLNLEDADFYFESETEGGIPRILAVFSSVDRVPDEIGPVRSARPHFAKFAAAMDMLYCHIGGSHSGLATIQQLGVNDVRNAEQTSEVLANSQNYSWNRKVFTKVKVLAEIKQRGYSMTTNYTSPYQFGEVAGDNPATTVDIKISGNYRMAFTYDTARGVYQKHRNALSSPVHTTHTGGTIEVSNVIVMYDNRFVDPLDDKRYDFTLQSGEGILASGGKSRAIRWENTALGLKYYEADGTTPLTVAVGKTYVCLTSNGFKSQTTVK